MCCTVDCAEDDSEHPQMQETTSANGDQVKAITKKETEFKKFRQWWKKKIKFKSKTKDSGKPVEILFAYQVQ